MKLITTENKDKVVNMVVIAPFAYPYLFMMDFRIYVLDTLVKITSDGGCNNRDHCQTVPDLLTLVWEKMTPIQNVFGHALLYECTKFRKP